MNTHAWLLLALFLAVLFAVGRPLGTYIARVVEGEYRVVRKPVLPLSN